MRFSTSSVPAPTCQRPSRLTLAGITSPIGVNRGAPDPAQADSASDKNARLQAIFDIGNSYPRNELTQNTQNSGT